MATALLVALVASAAPLAILQVPRFDVQELPRAPSARSKVVRRSDRRGVRSEWTR